MAVMVYIICDRRTFSGSGGSPSNATPKQRKISHIEHIEHKGRRPRQSHRFRNGHRKATCQSKNLRSSLNLRDDLFSFTKGITERGSRAQARGAARRLEGYDSGAEVGTVGRLVGDGGSVGLEGRPGRTGSVNLNDDGPGVDGGSKEQGGTTNALS